MGESLVERGCVLVVDDDDLFLELLSLLLEAEGFCTIRASSGGEALELFERRLPVVVLLDYELGDMTGVDVLRAIRRSDLAPQTPVLFFSGKDDIDLRRHAIIHEGADGFLVKTTDRDLVGAQVYAMARIRRREESLADEALRDVLTGLPNRRSVFRRIEAERRKGAAELRQVTCLMIDVDHFKRCNDTFGHTSGDLVLKEVAARLQSALRSGDFVGRYGGEEFLAILPGTGEAAALEVAERLRRVIEAGPISLEPQKEGVSVTVSIGCASGNLDVVGERELIDEADRALYFAKQSGRNQVASASSVPSSFRCRV